jgi:hypothetical protein
MTRPRCERQLRRPAVLDCLNDIIGAAWRNNCEVCLLGVVLEGFAHVHVNTAFTNWAGVLGKAQVGFVEAL